MGDFPVGPVVESLPSNAGDVDLTPGQGTEIPRGFRQLLSFLHYFLFGVILVTASLYNVMKLCT